MNTTNGFSGSCISVLATATGCTTTDNFFMPKVAYSHDFWMDDGWRTFQQLDNGQSVIKRKKPFNFGPRKLGLLSERGSGVSHGVSFQRRVIDADRN